MGPSDYVNRLVVGKSPFHSLTRILANKRRKLVRTPVNDNNSPQYHQSPVASPSKLRYCESAATVLPPWATPSTAVQPDICSHRGKRASSTTPHGLDLKGPMKRIHTLLAIGCGLLFAASTCFAQMYTAIDLVTPDTERCLRLTYVPEVSTPLAKWSGSCLFGHLPRLGFSNGCEQSDQSATDDLGTLGGAYSQACGINDLGQVVGISFRLMRQVTIAPSERLRTVVLILLPTILGIDGSSA